MNFGSRLRSPAFASACLAVIAAAAAIAGYATAGTGDTRQAVATTNPDAAYVRGVVRETGGGLLTMTSGGSDQQFQLSASVAVETLQPAMLEAIRTGDWLNIGAVQHAQTLFAITGLVVISPGNLASP